MLVGRRRRATITRTGRRRWRTVDRVVDRMATALLRLKSLSFGPQRGFQRNDSSHQVRWLTAMRRRSCHVRVEGDVAKIAGSEVADRA